MSHEFVEMCQLNAFDKKQQNYETDLPCPQCLAGGRTMEYQIGDIVRTKKQHPCGSKLWEITRVGVDFKLKCQGCGHVVVLERQKAIKVITKIEKKVGE